ncbi:HHIP-like protein 2 [Liolophura sinensis]|uniref:HHIP-like protein 2 n=1 Tax=Liolophura sinensis TaxID=3198878 RepID=UPI003158CAD7
MQFLPILLVNVVVVLAQVIEQPFCSDSLPPFSSAERGRLCLYKDYGCCTDGQDMVLLDTYIKFYRELRPRGLGFECNGVIVSLLCENCNPFAGTLFEVGHSLPLICGDSCQTIYKRCAAQIQLAIELTTNNSVAIASLSSVASFCSMMTPSNPRAGLCFPQSQTIARQVRSNPNTQESSCICVEKIAENFRNPLAFRHANDGSQRHFIAEQIGVVHILGPDGNRFPTPFLDISSRVFVSSRRGDERGFLGLEFHPRHFRNGKFYVFYCTRRSTGGFKTRISEFEVLLFNTDVADPNSERILLEIDQPYGNHNGGELLFGDDGYLYIFSGDGGAGGDPQNNAQNRNSLLGKVLRIDVNSRDGDLPYGIPADNPFLNDSNTRPEIYALGVRNIWRCGKDPGDFDTGEGKGRIICGDVGQGRFEELDLLVKGANYGWRGREGFECFNRQQCGRTPPEVLPLITYARDEGQSITGGHFYRGCDSPNLKGYYIFGDYQSGRLFKMKEDSSGNWNRETLSFCDGSVCMKGQQSFAERFILSFGQDREGEVYMLSTDDPRSSHPGGKVYKIVDPYRRGNPDTCRAEPGSIPRVSAGRPNIASSRGRNG